MIALLQLVTRASVTVNGAVIGAVNRGLLVLIGVEREDTAHQAERLAQRLTGYRVFEDADGKMNLCVKDIGGGVLLVPGSPWRLTRGRAPGRVFRPPRRRNGHNTFSKNLSGT